MRKFITPSTLIGLRYFCVAASRNSFTQAAQELHISQGAVSQQMRHLEERLGVALFRRRPKGVVLTDAGQRLYTEVSQAFLQIDEAMTGISEKNARVILSCTPSMALQWLVPRLARFHQLHPGIELCVKAEFQNLDRSSFSDDGIDIAIRYDSFDHSGLRVVNLMQEYLLPVAAPRFVETYREMLNVGSLEGMTLLYDSEPWVGAPDKLEWSAWLKAHPTIKIDGCATQPFNLFMLAIAAATGGHGILIARASQVLDELRAGRLVSACGHPILAPARHVLLAARKPTIHMKIVSDWLIDECAVSERDLVRTFDSGIGVGADFKHQIRAV